jgi:hypothetical protein
MKHGHATVSAHDAARWAGWPKGGQRRERRVERPTVIHAYLWRVEGEQSLRKATDKECAYVSIHLMRPAWEGPRDDALSLAARAP